MKIHILVFDVYGTLMDVGPPPADADILWQSLFRNMLGCPPPFGRLDFAVACDRIIARHHADARVRGIAWPEVHWPSVVSEALPAFSRLDAARQEEFLYRQMQTGHIVQLGNEVAQTLRALQKRGYLLGIASNAQAYTLRELETALASAGLNLSLFERDLCFWSYQHGFSKPDPHVFQILTARAQARGIHRSEILMVGDRLDNDIEPARAQCWQVWHLTTSEANASHWSGSWNALLGRLS